MPKCVVASCARDHLITAMSPTPAFPPRAGSAWNAAVPGDLPWIRFLRDPVRYRGRHLACESLGGRKYGGQLLLDFVCLTGLLLREAAWLKSYNGLYYRLISTRTVFEHSCY